MSRRAATLTDREALALEVIRAHVHDHGYQPSVRELAAAVGLRSPSSGHRLVTSLEAKGLIARVGGRPRALELRR